MEGTTTFLSFFLLRSFRSNDPPPPPLPLSRNSTSTAVLPPSLPPSFPPSLLLAEREEEKGILFPLSFFFLPPSSSLYLFSHFLTAPPLGSRDPSLPLPLSPRTVRASGGGKNGTRGRGKRAGRRKEGKGLLLGAGRNVPYTPI